MLTTLSIKLAEIPPGEGRTTQVGDQPYAVYNDGQAAIVLLNICPHADCQTEWNAAAKTWDCPCHGSRFEADGSLKRGPARRPLLRIPAEVVGDEIRIGG